MMRPLSALCLLSLFLVEEATCSYRHHKLSEFRAKLEEKAASNFNQAVSLLPSEASNNTRIGRVFYPIVYGADPSGANESSDAFLKTLGDAFQLQNGLELLPGINDLGGIVIDLQGGNYKINQPLRFPSGGGNLVVKGGTLRASDQFPTDRHLIELWSPSSKKLSEVVAEPIKHVKFIDSKDQNIGMYYEDITFRDILFDSSYRGGGIFLVDTARIRINNCFFLHFTTQGILVQKGHETFISNSFLGQHSTVGGDKGEKDYTATAIDLNSNDNAITDVAIFSAAVGIILRGQANILSGVHCYNKATGFGGIGIFVKLAGNSQTRIDNCYLDFTSIVLEDPVQVHVTNGLFLGDANIVLKSIHGQVFGLNIVDNMFNGSPQNKIPIVNLDGEFTKVDQVVIDRNNAIGMSLKSTVGKLVVASNGTKWAADFSEVLVFPNRISNFQYSFQSQGDPKFTSHAVTNVTNNVVVVESEKVVNALVSVVVEQ
ncbi:polygalacturonase QRT3 [Ziziphus jujuba]|uniref:Polygalacturonase QRT3 n=2 Tax=Ziziphus jujuba TaxID=326968 RepID=A0A6P4AY91_ZIZJJ|nr:polygalacturonase QRT3 [Ziziphus jujuba]KAH7546062.1 hypothetical protein FEM48_Zijuj01G0160700 [Ziziphus jujuba var. spinosa]